MGTHARASVCGFASSDRKKYPAFRTAYGQGGWPGDVLAALTGKKASILRFERHHAFIPWQDQIINTMMNTFYDLLEKTRISKDVALAVKPAFAALEQLKSKSEQEDLLLLNTVFDGDISQVYAWYLFMKHLFEKHKSEYTKLSMFDVGQQIESGQLNIYIKKIKLLNAKVFNNDKIIINIVDKMQGLLSSPTPQDSKMLERKGTHLYQATGSGSYNHYQVELFKQIQSALRNNQPVTITMGNKYKKGVFTFHQAFKVDGLFAGHVYTILECVEHPDGRRSVYLANPWKYHGASYTNKNGLFHIESQRKGQFPLDLNDITKYAYQLTIGAAITNRSNQAINSCHGDVKLDMLSTSPS